MWRERPALPPTRLRNRARFHRAALALLLLAWTGPASADPAEEACEPAIDLSEARHGLPPGLLRAIALVETGTRRASSRERRPWPWSVNVNGEGRYFRSKEEAAAWSRAAQAAGKSSIDVGCLQINLQHHPAAFSSIEEALDPVRNADYAGRFLRSLAAETGEDWIRAAGLYHSRRPELAQPYGLLVRAALGGQAAPAPQPMQVARDRRQEALSARAAWATRTAAAAARAAGVTGAEREVLLRLLLVRAGLPARPMLSPVQRRSG